MPKFNFEADDTVRFKVFAEGEQTGYIILHRKGTLLQFEHVDVAVNRDITEILPEFIDYLYEYCQTHDYTVASYASENKMLQHIRSLLMQSRFSYVKDLVNYVKILDTNESPFSDGYVLEPYLDRGKEHFIDILKQCSQNDPYYEDKSIEDKYNEWIAQNHKDSFWRLAFQGDDIIGVMLPIVNPHDPSIGKIDYIGVVPDERRQGHGIKLHNIALDILRKDLKASIYHGMTHKDNPMVNVFVDNHCEFRDVIVFNTKGKTE